MAFATHILVPTDFSDAAKLAVEAAALLAVQLRAKLSLVHVHDPGALRPPAQIAFSRNVQKDLDVQVREAAEGSLEALRAELAERVPAVKASVVDHESAAQGVVEHAEVIGADLIVIATHGRTGLKHLLIGSVAERVVRFSPVPVLTLRSKSAD